MEEVLKLKFPPFHLITMEHGRHSNRAMHAVKYACSVRHSTCVHQRVHRPQQQQSLHQQKVSSWLIPHALAQCISSLTFQDGNGENKLLLYSTKVLKGATA